MFKKILLALLVLAVIGVGTAIYLWNKPLEKAEDLQGLKISATELAEAYAKDEHIADSLYLDRALEVSGKVIGSEKNLDGGLMVILESGDPTADVQCSMRDTGVVVSNGELVNVVGFCSGNNITGVSLTRCILKK